MPLNQRFLGVGLLRYMRTRAGYLEGNLSQQLGLLQDLVRQFTPRPVKTWLAREEPSPGDAALGGLLLSKTFLAKAMGLWRFDIELRVSWIFDRFFCVQSNGGPEVPLLKLPKGDSTKHSALYFTEWTSVL